MVKSFHKKRKNFKNKTKRNKLRRTKKNKNKKMIGGTIEENMNNFGENILIGFSISNRQKYYLYANKNIKYDVNEASDQSLRRYDSYLPCDLDVIYEIYFNKNWIYERLSLFGIPVNKNKFIYLSLENLSSLPNIHNLNIYRIFNDGAKLFDNNGNVFLEKYKRKIEINKNIFSNSIIRNELDNNIFLLDLLAFYVDLKYHKILIVSKTIRGNTNNIIMYNRTTDSLNLNKDDGHPLNYFKNIILIELEKYPKLKEEIMNLERTYPYLIARIILETDAELAGEEPRENRMKRASSILEQGMKKFPSVSSKEIPILKSSYTNNKNIRPESLSSDDESIPSKEISSDEEQNFKKPLLLLKKKLEYDSDGIPFISSSDDEEQNLKKNTTTKKKVEYDSDDIPEYSSSEEEEIDMTTYKVITLRGVRYAALESEINNQDIFNIYELKEYKNVRDFKIKSKNPIGTFNKKNKSVKIFKKT